MKKNTAYNRRHFIGDITKASIIGLLPNSSFAEETNAPADASNTLFVTKPYLQNLSSNACTIMWITGKSCTSWVEYGKESPEQKAVHTNLGLVDANNFIHKITLNNLQPGTTYCYRVCSREIADFQPYKLTWGNDQQSELFYFTTPDTQTDTVSWVVLNDIHDRPASFPLLFSLIKDFQYDFVFLNGDMFDF